MTLGAITQTAIAGPLFYRRWFSRQQLDDAFVRGVVERRLIPLTQGGL
jgi:hypothetical protein